MGRSLAAALVILTSGCFLEIPPPDTCTIGEGAGSPSGLEVGDGTFDDVFVPWPEGEVTVTTVHAEVAYLTLRLRATGPQAASCMHQRTRVVTKSEKVSGTADGPVGFYRQHDGSRVTRTIYVSLASGADLPCATVESEVGGITVRRTLACP